MVFRSRRADAHPILLDLNTQCDFLMPRGAMPVLNRDVMVPNLRRLMEHARSHALPVISSMDAHRPEEPIHGAPRHCIDNTYGQRKLPFTLLPRRLVLSSDNTLDVPADVFARHRQIIMAKRSRDFLNNPKADRLIGDLPVEYYVVFGVATEMCVKSVVLGLIARRRPVVVVTDALGHWNAAEAELAVRQMTAKGAVAATTEEILGGRVFEFPCWDGEREPAAAPAVGTKAAILAALQGARVVGQLG